MSDIAKTMADRIRNAAGGAGLLTTGPGPSKISAPAGSRDYLSAPTGKAARQLASGMAPTAPADRSGSINDRQAYVLEAATQFQNQFGVSLSSVAALFVPRNDFVYAAAEENVALDDFVRTTGSQFAFESIVGKDSEYASWVAGENAVKLALAEYAYAVGDFTFTDGYAVTDHDGEALVIAPSFDETISSWQFAAYRVACDKDAFVAMSRAEKASTPSEARVYGDIDDCVAQSFRVEAAPSAPRM